MTPHVLDNPVWHALGGPHRALGSDQGGLRRYHPAITVFGAIEHPERGDLSPIAALGPGEVIALGTVAQLTPPAGFEVVLGGRGVQMVAEQPRLVPARFDYVTLGADDVPAMMELTALTRPGPFSPRTHEMGHYIGIRDGDRLVAMAGERMHPPGFSEISAVCTHPDYRGRGYAPMLVSVIAAEIMDRGETPFLHTFADNVVAIAAYEKLGFVHRTDIYFMVMRRMEATAD